MTKPADTPCDVKAYALIDVLAYMLAGIKKNTNTNMLVEVEHKTLGTPLPDVITEPLV